MLFHGISPRAAAASASACHSAGDAAGGPHAIRAGARDEHRGHGLSQRQAGGDVAGRGLPRQECGLPLFGGLERDLLAPPPGRAASASRPSRRTSPHPRTDRPAGRWSGTRALMLLSTFEGEGRLYRYL